MILKQERDPQKFQQELERKVAELKARKRAPWLMAAAFAGAFLAMMAGQEVARARLIEIDRTSDGSGGRICICTPDINGTSICYCWWVSTPIPAPDPSPQPPPDPPYGRDQS